MASKPIILVAGITGHQGAPIACALMQNTKFQVRGLCSPKEDPAKVKHLTDKGIEVIQADLHDKEALKPALKGVHAAFLVTIFHEGPNDEKK
jgi:uncharacterized protein YbjT (DUF2867 family)